MLSDILMHEAINHLLVDIGINTILNTDVQQLRHIRLQLTEACRECVIAGLLRVGIEAPTEAEFTNILQVILVISVAHYERSNLLY